MSTDTKKRCNHVEEDIKLRRGPWTLEEDALLTHYIASHGEGRWDMLAKCSGLKRTGKSCRLRWLNYLKPDVKRGNLTLEEQILILELHSKWGNRWSKIAQSLPGRTDNEIKNYWRTRVQKQARQLKIDANSNKFRDVIQRFWMPRLLQKMKKSNDQSSYSTMNPQSSQSTLTLNQVPQELSQPPPPLPPQHGSLSTRKTIKSLNLQESNLSSENCTSPSITSDSMNINSQIPEISEYLTSPHAFGNIVYNPFLKSCYNMDSNSYDMETFNLTPISDCHVAESNWVNDDMADNLWNIDELWQFRQLQGKGITHC